MKRWLYVVQQRLAITNTEATALLTIGFLLIAGLIVGEVRGRMARFSDEAYALSDRLVRDEAMASLQGTILVSADTTTTPDTTASGQSIAPESDGVAPEPSKAPAFVLDLNTATAADLERLPRIGPALAARIIAFRQDNGPFRALEELMDVRGIGKATFARLRPYLSLSAPRDTAATDPTFSQDPLP